MIDLQMNEILSYILLGVFQGTFEWLPISTQGGLFIYLTNILKISIQDSLNYSIFLHLGTLFSAIIYFRKDLLNILTKKNIYLFLTKNFKLLKIDESKENSLLTLRFLFISLLFTLLVSGPLYFFIRVSSSNIKNILFVNLIIGVLLIFTGLLIFFSRKSIFKKPKLTLKNSFLLGIFQGFSVIPGFSRSGLTTSLLLFRGFSPEKAFRLSFLLSIPTVFIGEVAILVFNGFFFSPLIIISLVVSFFFGYLTIDLLIRFAKNINFSNFCFILGFIYILTFFL